MCLKSRDPGFLRHCRLGTIPPGHQAELLTSTTRWSYCKVELPPASWAGTQGAGFLTLSEEGGREDGRKQLTSRMPSAAARQTRHRRGPFGGKAEN